MDVISIYSYCDFSFMQEYPLIFFGIICLAISSTSVSLAPYLFGKVIDNALPGQTNWYGGIFCLH